MATKEPIIVIVGPTASGKSDLAVTLAKAINGEVISADSRQVYRGMDIGTGKITREEQQGIRHHLLDIANPKLEYNISHFLQDTEKAIQDIESRGKRVIVCGGSTFWIEALLFGMTLPSVAPDKAFRAKWGWRSKDELLPYLKRLDPERAKTVDVNNRIRILRAIEIAKTLGKVPVLPTPSFDINRFFIIGLNPPVEILNQKIRSRFKARMKAGMLEEVKKLNRAGVNYERLESFGLEYRALTRHLQGKLTLEEVNVTLPYDIIHYAKRQRSSLRRLEKRGATIHWVENASQALELVS
jgi:tRNA dimethylallyltransferase